MNMHFEKYDMSIIDGQMECPNVTNTEKASEVDKKKTLAWKRDNARTTALIASALSQLVAYLVLTQIDAKDIWDKLVSVYEESSIQRLNLLVTEFFKVLERVMYNQLQEHLNKYGNLAEEQFGFRADSTTNKAMYKLINETLNALNSKLIVGGIFFILKRPLTA